MVPVLRRRYVAKEKQARAMFRIGIDIGGTFTDVVATSGGQMHYAKSPSSPDVVEGILGGVDRVLAEAGIDPTTGMEIMHLHGTTIATNALLERKGARIGLLGTAGHQDALELGRMKRSHLYDLTRGAETPVHLAPGRQRIGIRERIDGRGHVLVALDEAQVEAEARRLVDHFGVEAFAICFLNAYANPEHERRAGDIVRSLFPDLPVSLSCEVNPVFREYERVCCTAFDAYVRPKVEHYVAQLASGLKDGAARLHLMQSRGGIASARMARERPVTMFLSGPAAGVIAGQHVAQMSERRDLITFDVGGTSTDVALVRDGEVAITQSGRIGPYQLRLPMVGLETIGSGGGSIAWLDAGGGLHVGPYSAGSVPGPACYCRGGEEPTATDASVVLGYVNPDYFAGGTMALDAKRAHAVIGALAARLGLGKVEVALGIFRILVSQMAEAIKLVTIKRGVDPRNFCLVSFGGGGGIFAPMVARELGIAEVLVPRHPGTLSALGLLVADFEYAQVASFFARNAAEPDFAGINETFTRLQRDGEAMVAREGFAGALIGHRRSLDMRYLGQAYELEIEIPDGDVTTATVSAAVADFNRAHRAVYGHASTDRQAEIVNVRLVTTQKAPRLDAALLRGGLPRAGAEAVPLARRTAHFPDAAEVETAVFRRAELAPGSAITGPAIIESADTTVVLQPGQSAAVDEAGNLMIRAVVSEGVER
jgi:N-methylhydantoinase A/oxoprolinase/acetone carboxylase beta subunit